MHFENPASLVRVAGPRASTYATLAKLTLLVGVVALALPTMIHVARDVWTSEQGSHGPLVLATGVWALWREVHTKKPETRPGSLLPSLLLVGFTVSLFVVARITGILEIESFAMYGALISAAYMLWGAPLMRTIWFPLIYLAFALPPPDQVVMAVTQPAKIAISQGVVSLLYLFGYPVASSGVRPDWRA